MTDEEITEELQNFLQTSNGFDMHFQLKQEILNTLQHSRRQQASSELEEKLSLHNGSTTAEHQLDALISTYRQHGSALDLKMAMERLIEQEVQP